MSRIADRYELDEQLDSASVEERWRATDTQTDTTVTVSLLPFTEARMERLLDLKELGHPNVEEVLDVGRDGDERLYLVTEYVGSNTLAGALALGALPASWVSRLSGQLCRALVAAHHGGLAHGHLDPGAIVLSERYGEASWPTVIGLGYADTATPRDDLRALGALMLRMATGSDDPERWTDAPPPARELIRALLDSDHPPDAALVAERLETGEERLATMESPRGAMPRLASLELPAPELPEPSPAAPPRSPVQFALFAGLGVVAVVSAAVVLAVWASQGNERPPAIVATPAPEHASLDDASMVVVPFLNDGEAWAGRGLSETVAWSLTRAEGVRADVVLADGAPPPEIAERVGLAGALAGRVRPTEAGVEVGAELSRAGGGEQVWAQRVERSIPTLIEAHDVLVAGIAHALGRATPPPPTTQPHAFAALVYGIGRSVAGEHTDAATALDLAVSEDPDLTLGWAWLALNAAAAADRARPAAQAWVETRAAAEVAVAQDPDLALAHLALGIAQLHTWHWEHAEAELRRALDLDDALGEAHRELANLLVATGRPEQALRSARLAVELSARGAGLTERQILAWTGADPESGIGGVVLDESLRALMEGHALLSGDTDGAWERLSQLELSTDRPILYGLLARAGAARGHTAEAERIASELAAADTDGRTALGAAHAYLGLGHVDRALGWARVAAERQARDAVGLLADPLWQPLRDDEGWSEVLAALGR